jgi:hypothetical protein
MNGKGWRTDERDQVDRWQWLINNISTTPRCRQNAPPLSVNKADKTSKKKKTKPTSTSGPYTTLQLPLSNEKSATYTKAQLEAFFDLRVRRYEDLLQCARTNATHCMLLKPDPGLYAISMARNCYTLRVKLELLDIFHYLQKHLTKSLAKGPTKTKSTVSYRNFGHNIGMDIPHSTLQGFLKNEDKIRAMAEQLPSIPSILSTARTECWRKSCIYGYRINSRSRFLSMER